MSKWDKLLEKILSGRADANIRFDDLCNLLRRNGFAMHVSGSHHIFENANYPIVNLQPAGANAKPYQVKQLRKLLQDRPLQS